MIKDLGMLPEDEITPERTTSSSIYTAYGRSFLFIKKIIETFM